MAYTFYVVPETGGGTPTGDGSIGDPWNGFGNVLWSGAAGVEVNAGDTLIATGSFSDEILAVGVSGTAENIVTIDLTNASLTHSTNYCLSTFLRSYLNIIGGTIGGVSTTQRDVFISRSDTVVVDGTTFLKNTGSNTESVYMYLEITSPGVANITFKNCIFYSEFRIYHSGTHTFYLDGFLLENCTFNQAGFRTIYTDDVYSLVTNQYGPRNCIIRNCTFNACPNAAIFLTGWYGTANSWNIVENNTLIDTGVGGGDLTNAIQTSRTLYTIIRNNSVTGTFTTGTGDGHSIILDHVFDDPTYYPSENCIVENNYCTTAENSEALGAAGINVWRGKDCIIRNNIIEDTLRGLENQNAESTGNVFYNNICINNSYCGAYIQNQSPQSEWYNNIFIGGENGIQVQPALSTPPIEENNIFYNQTGASILVNSVPIAIDSTSIEADPMLDSNYIPDPNSPCYRAGKGISFSALDRAGNKFKMPPTIGAYEIAAPRMPAKAGRKW